MNGKSFNETFRKLWDERKAETERICREEQEATVRRITHYASIRTDALAAVGVLIGDVVTDPKGRLGSIQSIDDHGWATVKLQRKDGTWGRETLFFDWEKVKP